MMLILAKNILQRQQISAPANIGLNAFDKFYYKLTARFPRWLVHVVAKLETRTERRIPKRSSIVGLPAWRRNWSSPNRERNLWITSARLVPNRSLHRDELEGGRLVILFDGCQALEAEAEEGRPSLVTSEKATTAKPRFRVLHVHGFVIGLVR